MISYLFWEVGRAFRRGPVSFTISWILCVGVVVLLHELLFRIPPGLPDRAVFEREALPQWVEADGEFTTQRPSETPGQAILGFEGTVQLSTDLYQPLEPSPFWAEHLGIAEGWWQFLSRHPDPELEPKTILTRSARAGSIHPVHYHESITHGQLWLIPPVSLPWDGSPRSAYRADAVLLDGPEAEAYFKEYITRAAAHLGEVAAKQASQSGKIEQEATTIQNTLITNQHQMEHLLAPDQWYLATLTRKGGGEAHQFLVSTVSGQGSTPRLAFYDPHLPLTKGDATGEIIGWEQENQRLEELRLEQQQLKQQRRETASLQEQFANATLHPPEKTPEQPVDLLASFPLHFRLSTGSESSEALAGTAEFGLNPHENGLSGSGLRHDLRLSRPEKQTFEQLKAEAMVQLEQQRAELAERQATLQSQRDELKLQIAEANKQQWGTLVPGSRFMGTLPVGGSVKDVVVIAESYDPQGLRLSISSPELRNSYRAWIEPTESEKATSLRQSLANAETELEGVSSRLTRIEQAMKQWESWQLGDIPSRLAVDSPAVTEEKERVDQEPASPFSWRWQSYSNNPTLNHLAVESERITAIANQQPVSLERVLSEAIDAETPAWQTIAEWCQRHHAFYLPHIATVLEFSQWNLDAHGKGRLNAIAYESDGKTRNVATSAQSIRFANGVQVDMIDFNLANNLSFRLIWGGREWLPDAPFTVEALPEGIDELRSQAAGLYQMNGSRLVPIRDIGAQEDITSTEAKVGNLFKGLVDSPLLKPKKQVGYRSNHRPVTLSAADPTFYLVGNIPTAIRYAPAEATGNEDTPWQVTGSAEAFQANYHCWGKERYTVTLTTLPAGGTYLLQLVINDAPFHLLVTFTD